MRDTGHGIADADKDRIFDRFARGAVSADDEGFGLGLSIVAAIAHAHGGTVHAEDATGGAPGSPSPSPSEPEGRRGQDPDRRGRAAHRVVHRQGARRPRATTTVEVGDGERRSTYALGGEFDLVILDIGLPGINGFEVLEQLRPRAAGSR